MSIFGTKKNNFEQNQEQTNVGSYQQPQQEPIDARPEVKGSDFVDYTDPNETEQEKIQTTPDRSKLVSINYGTGMPIDAIYVYIEKNWEDVGRNDAALNPDISYMNAQMEIIKQGLSRRIEMVRLKYNKMIRDYKAQSENLQTFGLLGTTVQLDAHIKTCEEHLKKLEELEQKFKNGDTSLMSMVDSYKRGFSMGVAFKTQQTINEQDIN